MLRKRERLRSGISRHSFLDQAAQIELRAAELDSSALAGAAELALQPLLDDPTTADVMTSRPTPIGRLRHRLTLCGRSTTADTIYWPVGA